jgi:hypothetical protein
MLVKIEGKIKNRQSRDTGNIGHIRHETLDEDKPKNKNKNHTEN